MALKGNKYGTHRVIEPKGVLTHSTPTRSSATSSP